MAASWRKLFTSCVQKPRVLSYFSSLFLSKSIPVQYPRCFSFAMRNKVSCSLSWVHYLYRKGTPSFTREIMKQHHYHSLSPNYAAKATLNLQTPSLTSVRTFPTISQIMRGKRRTKKRKEKTMKAKVNQILRGPQRKGVCINVFIRRPKKPNSANRKCALLRLNDGQTVIAYIPGEKASLQEHGVVLFEGGKVQDCPGVNYKIIRGKYDVN